MFTKTTEPVEKTVITYVKLPKAKNAALWKHFGFKSKDGKKPVPELMTKVYCQIPGCKEPELPYSGNTTNLSRHLQTHPFENATYLGHSPSSDATSPSIKSFMSPRQMGLNDTKSKRVTAGIVAMIVEDLRPMNMVSCSGFKKFCEAACPEYPLASASYYTDQIGNKYSVAAAAMKESLKTVKEVAIGSSGASPLGGGTFVIKNTKLKSYGAFP
jgi:hypothetical protein